MENIATAWSIEIQDPPEPLTDGYDGSQSDGASGADDGTSAVAVYEQTIQDPKRITSMTHPGSQQGGNKIEVETSDMQGFLTKQLEVLEQLKVEDEKDRAAKKTPQLEMSPLDDNGRVNEHIGPVQFNMGGIQVDADDMLRKLKVRLSRVFFDGIEPNDLIRSAKPTGPSERTLSHHLEVMRKHITKH
jgi:dynein light intermediate chain 1